MLSRILWILSAALVFQSICAFAAENNYLSLKPEVQRGDLGKPQGLWPFLGVGLGLTPDNPTIRTGGIPTHFKVLGSYYFAEAPWVGDFGVGLHNQFLTQDGGDSDSIQSLYTELAARYELSNRWQLGAIWNTLVDNPDRFKSNTENLASFLGLQVMKEFTYNGEYLIRAGGRAMTDVGISGETIDTVMAELEVSIGPGRGSRVSKVEEPIPHAVRAQPQPIAPHLDSRAMQTFRMEPQPVRFESDSIKLTSSSRAYLSRLARVLAANHELYERIEVTGHADQRGPELYNKKLSMRRAQNISNSLLAAGISKNQIKVVARGEDDLLTSSMTASALSRNRRVQIEFKGVKNQAALRILIDSASR